MPPNQSLVHGLQIVFLFDPANPYLRVSEISKRLKYSQSKTYRLVKTLVEWGLLQEVAEKGRYSLGLGAFRLSLLAQRHFSLPEIARPHMKELSLVTKETVILTAVQGRQGVCVEVIESREPIRYSFFQPGAILPLPYGASSKVLMAHLPEGDLRQVLAGIKGLEKPLQWKKLLEQLQEVREKQCALSHQEVNREARGVAAPILDGTGQLAAILSVAGPVYRIDEKKFAHLGSLTVRYAQRIAVEWEALRRGTPGGGMKEPAAAGMDRREGLSRGGHGGFLLENGTGGRKNELA